MQTLQNTSILGLKLCPHIYIPLLCGQQYSDAQALCHISSGCCVSPGNPKQR